MTSAGENSIYVNSGNRSSLDRIGTNTTGDRIDIGYLTNTEVVPTCPKFFIFLDCKWCCAACILYIVLNMEPHCLHPYYEIVVFRMHDSLPFEKRKYRRTQFKQHRFMWQRIYRVWYFDVTFTSSLLNITYSYVRTTPVYNDTKFSVPFMKLMWLWL